MPQRKQGPQPQQRMYSFQVRGWNYLKGERDDERQAAVVATSHDEAIAEAREVLDPKGDLDEWAIAGVGELNPAEAKAWAAWHRTATSPLERAEATESK